MKYITSTPTIMGGAPVVAGSRVPIAVIVSLLKQGYTVEAIHDEFPHVPLKKINGAITELVDKLSDADNAAKIL